MSTGFDIFSQIFNNGFTNISQNFNHAIPTNDHNNKPPPASKAAIDSLPMIKLTADDLIEETNKECLICLCEQEVGTISCKMPCGHIFHKICIADWLFKQCTCPVCRYEIETNSYHYEKIRKEKMKSRRVRVGIEELKRKTVGQLKTFCQDCQIDIRDCYDKHEIIEKIANSSNVTVVDGVPQIEITESEFLRKPVGELKKMLLSFGISTDGALEKVDLRTKLIESGRILLLADEKEDIPELEVDLPRPKFPLSTVASSSSHEKADVLSSSVDNVPSNSSTPSSSGSEVYTLEELSLMQLSCLRELCKRHGISIVGCIEKCDVIDRIKLSPFSANFVRTVNVNSYSSNPLPSPTASHNSENFQKPLTSVSEETSSKEDLLRNMSLSKLRAFCKENTIDMIGCLDRADIVDRIMKSSRISAQSIAAMYYDASSPNPSSSAGK